MLATLEGKLIKNAQAGQKEKLDLLRYEKAKLEKANLLMRNQILQQNTKKETQAKIDSGEYTLTNLN